MRVLTVRVPLPSRFVGSGVALVGEPLALLGCGLALGESTVALVLGLDMALF